MSIAIRKMYNAIFALVALFCVAVASYAFWRPAPDEYYHRVIESKIEPAVVKRGEPIITHVIVERNAPEGCTIELHRFIASSSTGIVVWAQIAPGIATNGREVIKRHVFPIPPLEPGNYRYHFRAVSTCPNNIYIFGHSLGAPFTITP
jgi:hypothetical protein